MTSGKLASEVGVEKYALENFSAMPVWNPETLFRLRNEVGPTVGMNLDPSHLMWMGADLIASARALGSAIHHCHGKDTRIERGPADVRRPAGTEGSHGCRQPHMELRSRRRWPRPAMVEGILLRRGMVEYNGWVSLEMEDFTQCPPTPASSPPSMRCRPRSAADFCPGR